MTLLLVMSAASVLAVIFIPKYISALEMYTTSFFATFLAALADFYLDVKLDLYGFFDKGVDWEYLLIFIVIYPAANILFLNFYPYENTWMRKLLYIFSFSAATISFEYISLQTDVFYYNGWTLLYSALCYPVLYTILLLNLHIIRKLGKHTKHI